MEAKTFAAKSFHYYVNNKYLFGNFLVLREYWHPLKVADRNSFSVALISSSGVYHGLGSWSLFS